MKTEVTCEKNLTCIDSCAVRGGSFPAAAHIFLLGYVPTESMEPTLEKGSYILGIRVCGELKTGDIVIFEYEGRLLVKRIAAGPSDVIERNGTHIIVPENSYYMLGDNSNNSYDSRFWSDPFIAKKNIVAKLIIQ